MRTITAPNKRKNYCKSTRYVEKKESRGWGVNNDGGASSAAGGEVYHWGDVGSDRGAHEEKKPIEMCDGHRIGWKVSE